jgi:hypothetical protein
MSGETEKQTTRYNQSDLDFLYNLVKSKDSEFGTYMSTDDFKAINDEALAQNSDPNRIFNRYNEWKNRTGAANKTYLDIKTQLISNPGRRGNIIANGVQSMSKLLSKSVI